MLCGHSTQRASLCLLRRWDLRAWRELQRRRQTDHAADRMPFAFALPLQPGYTKILTPPVREPLASPATLSRATAGALARLVSLSLSGRGATCKGLRQLPAQRDLDLHGLRPLPERRRKPWQGLRGLPTASGLGLGGAGSGARHDRGSCASVQRGSWVMVVARRHSTQKGR